MIDAAPYFLKGYARVFEYRFYDKRRENVSKNANAISRTFAITNNKLISTPNHRVFKTRRNSRLTCRFNFRIFRIGKPPH